MLHPDYKKYVRYLIVLTTLLRVFAGTVLELGNDEVYYWTYSQHLQWNYFDHPPLVALWIRLFTANLSLQDHEVFIRLGSIMSCAACTWVMYRIGAKLHSARAGWLAACLYTASIYASLIAGLFIMPDSPQMLFWCLSLYLLLHILKNETSWAYWLLFGLSAGLCIMSKVHGVFLWIGFGLFILAQQRNFFKRPQLYVSVLTTAVVASPILMWNIANQFITYRYHSERVVVQQADLNLGSFLRELLGQIAYNNPVVVGLTVLALLAWRKRTLLRSQPLALFVYIALPLIFILLLVSLFRNTLSHWSGPAYVTLLPLTAVYLANATSQALFPNSLRWALGLFLVVILGGTVLIKSLPGTLGSTDAAKFGKGDFTLDMYGWRQAGKTFGEIYKRDVANGLAAAGTPVVCYKWFPAAHEQFYFCRPLGIPMIGLGSLFDLHEYGLQKHDIKISKAYCIVPSNAPLNIAETYGGYFSTMDSVATLKSFRNGKLARCFYVFRLSGFKGFAPR